jgi:predicted P-loop ATPase
MGYKLEDLLELDGQIDTAHKDNVWKSKLEIDQKGNIKNVISNYITYITQSSKYKDKFRYNDFTKQKEFCDREFNDFDLNILYNNIERELNLSSHSKVDSALMEIFEMNKYNPIIEYLNSVKWDGQKRVESLFVDLLNADNTELNRYMTKIWFVAAVKRIFEPGCKFDNMIVLQGEQGIGKSSICDKISLKYSNNISLNEIGHKDLINKLNRTWIAVVDELDSFNKKEMSNIKTFISNTKDTARLAFGKNAETYSRHCVFIGSTNDTTFLRDNTSLVERRFWVIKCNKTNRDGRVFDILTDDYVSQLWAESVYYYRENPNMYLDISEELMNDFANEMKQFKTFNDDVIIDYVTNILEKYYKLDKKGEFNSEMDLLNQYTNNNEYENDKGSKITKIPYSYLRYVLKAVYHEERAGTYIGNSIGNDWKYKSIRYHDNPCKGYERKNCNHDLFCNCT